MTMMAGSMFGGKSGGGGMFDAMGPIGAPDSGSALSGGTTTWSSGFNVIAGGGNVTTWLLIGGAALIAFAYFKKK